MDDRKNSISPYDLDVRLGSETAPVVVDPRRADFAGAETLVADTLDRSPDAVEEWRTDLPGGRQVVSYCFQGREVSQQGVAAAPRLVGIEANFLEGHSIIRPDRDRAVAMSPS